MICVFFNFKPVSNLYKFLFYIYNKNLICFNGKKNGRPPTTISDYNP